MCCLLKVQNWSKMTENIANATTLTPNNPDKYTLSEYTHHLNISQQEQYEKKPRDLKIMDPDTIPEAVFTPLTDVALPDLQYLDIQAYLLPTPIKIHRSTAESSKKFRWISILYWWLGREPHD